MNTKSLDPSLFSRSASAITHPSHLYLLKKFIGDPKHLENFNRDDVEFFYQSSREFLNRFIANFNGFAEYTPFFSDGTTGFFHQIYLYLGKRRVATFKGEYPYHKNICDRMGIPIDLLHSADSIKPNHLLILSLPFSGDGNNIKNINDIVSVCEQKDVPIFLDLALIGLNSQKISIPRSQCIKAMAYSLTKSFNLARYRIGCVFVKDPIWPGNELDHWNYVNLFSIRLANFYFSHFHLDRLIEIARVNQHKICSDFNLEPSESYIFGLSRDTYPEFDRDNYISRVCISGAISDLLRDRPEDELIK